MRMAKSVGKAFEKAITIQKEPRQKGQREGQFEFMNKNRREIFQYLCLHPCSYLSMISKSLGLSLHATNWHLRRLVAHGYVFRMKMGKKAVFYPTEMIAKEDIPILEILNTEKAKAIFLVILEKNGVYQREICELLGLKHQAVIWYTKKLESLSLITIVEDGKYRRYYPTELLRQRREDNAARLKNFKQTITKRFRTEMLSPTILRSTGDKIVVRIKSGRDKAVLTLHTNPFVTVLS